MPELRKSGRAGRRATAKTPSKPSADRRRAANPNPSPNPNTSRRVGAAGREEKAVALAQPEPRENPIELEEGEGDNNGVELATAEEKMDEFDSGGRSGDNRLAGGEDEGSTAPLPDTVRCFVKFL